MAPKWMAPLISVCCNGPKDSVEIICREVHLPIDYYLKRFGCLVPKIKVFNQQVIFLSKVLRNQWN